MNQFFISCKETRIEETRSFYGCFYLGPFQPNQSITIANALRRTLLSEITGLAITCVEIEGVTHEYSNIPGIKDSVLDILLNIKEIVLKKTCKNFKSQIGYLRVKGPGIVRARDLRLPPFIQCVDPNQYIATLSTDGVLNMKFIISYGKNYIVSQNKNTDPFFKKDKRLQVERSLILKKLKQFSNYVNFEENKLGILHTTKLLNKYKKNKENIHLNTLITHKSPSALGHLNEALNSGQIDSKSPENSSQKKIKSFNSNPLNIDAIFNPITKVNYIIEVNDYKTVHQAFEIANQTEDFYQMLNLYTDAEGIKKINPLSGKANFKNPSALGHLNETLKDKVLKLIPKDLDNLLQLKEELSMIKKETVSHNIILEIWTNGSIHPRDALYLAFKNLTRIFLKLQKTWIFNPIYKVERNYNYLIKQLKQETSNELNPITDVSFLSTYTNPKLKQSNFLSIKSGIKKQLKLKFLKLNKNKLKFKEIQKINPQVQIVEKSDISKQDIGFLNISLRTYTSLKRLNINTIGDLLDSSKKISLINQNLDKKYIDEIEACLSKIGQKF